MTPYEQKQVQAIERWKREEPGIVSQAFDFVTAPLTWAVEKVIPVGLVQKVIEGTNLVAQTITDSKDILRDGEVSFISELRAQSLRLPDRLADDVHNWAIGMAGAAGGALGATGVGGIALDVGTLITLALRTIHKIGLCYGYERVDDQFVFGVLAVSTAANRREKKTAIELLRDVERVVIEEVWGNMVNDAVKSSVARGCVFFTALGVSKRVCRYLIKRKSLQLVPLVGAVLGGTTNVAFLADVGWAARRLFQERWLMENGRLPKPERSEDKASAKRQGVGG